MTDEQIDLKIQEWFGPCTDKGMFNIHRFRKFARALLAAGASEFREVGVWDADGYKFRTYKLELLNGQAMYVKESSND